MRSVFGCLRWGLRQRLRYDSFRFVGGVSSAIATKTSAAGTVGGTGITPSVVLTDRRHIASFKGTPSEFIEEVNREKTAIVYFYTGWCEPCNRLTAKLERLAANGASNSNNNNNNNIHNHNSNNNNNSNDNNNSNNAEMSPEADASSVSALSSPSSSATTSSTSSLSSSSSSSSLSPSSSSSSSSPISSSCCSSASSCCCLRPSTKVDSPPNDAGVVSEPTPHAEEVSENSSELCLPTRVNGAKVRVVPVDTDENPKLGALHDIRSIPTLVAYRRGRIVGRVEGFDEQELRKLVRELIQDNDQDTPLDSSATGKGK